MIFFFTRCKVGMDRRILPDSCVFRGRVLLVEYLIKIGDNVNQSIDEPSFYPQGWTPLHAAIRYPVIVKMLLDAGANVNAGRALGFTPIVEASKMLGSGKLSRS